MYAHVIHIQLFLKHIRTAAILKAPIQSDREDGKTGVLKTRSVWLGLKCNAADVSHFYDVVRCGG